MDTESSFLSQVAAAAILRGQYRNDAAQALQDESELVRREAVREAEKRDSLPALFEALQNSSSSVRRVAAWYMGRKRIQSAVDSLVELVRNEQDSETLRAAIWSLGVLRDRRALDTIEAFRQHSSPVVSAAADDALSKFVS